MRRTGPLSVNRRDSRRGILSAVFLPTLVAILVAGCGVTTSRITPSPTGSPTATNVPTWTPFPAPTATPAPPVFDCPDPGQPAIGPDATLKSTPESGPIGATIQLVATGLQPGCHLFVGIRFEPCLCETNNVPFPAPDNPGDTLQWVQVNADGSVNATIQVCSPLYFFPAGYRPSPCVMAYPELGHSYSAAGLLPGDYFYLTLGGATIPSPPPLFAKFSVTR